MAENTEGAANETEGTPAANQGSLLAPDQGQSNPAGQGEGGTAGNEGSPDPNASAQGQETGQEQDADKGDKSEKVGAPDEYEDFSTPEGVEVDEQVLGNFKEVAKELNLTQEQAQKLVDFQAEQAKAHETNVNEYYDNLMQEWQTNAKNDKEIGGRAFDESVANAKVALDAFATPELREALDNTGMGNHPEFIRVFARMGKAIKEDKVRVGGTHESSAAKDPAQILYPNHK